MALTATGLAAALQKARTVVKALVPTRTKATDPSAPSSAYTETDGLLPPEQEPQTSDRLFCVEAGGDEITGTFWGDDKREGIGSLRVRVRYDGGSNHETADERIAEDREQIVTALEKAANRATGTLLVEATATEIDRTTPDNPELRISCRVIWSV